ncbi:hypothetical protein CDAR_600531 [Caerostris darwini]|uniref:Uncharacterized protein n=1 Tax=Caerostris darwini TaxID=1538125 RepID=A0AAV4TV45_9ARAC|nr:hypothetical protein CDAR_600531 [Caerostris darwini]
MEGWGPRLPPFDSLGEKKGVGVQFPGIGSKPQPRTKKKMLTHPRIRLSGNCRVAARSVRDEDPSRTGSKQKPSPLQVDTRAEEREIYMS